MGLLRELDRGALAGVAATVGALHLFGVVALLAAGAGHPALPALGLLAYGLGLRHALDADHIAAIDNVTRRLRDAGSRPVSVGLHFALGHSTVVLLASLLVALLAQRADAPLRAAAQLGAHLGAVASAGFLLLIGALNLGLLRRQLAARRRGDTAIAPPPARGVSARWAGALLARVERPRRMFGVGLAFGLGFDTAGAVAVLGMAALLPGDAAARWAAPAFALLFAAGMTLLDSLDGLAMLCVYDWALRDDARKLGFNITVTALSVAAALGIGGFEAVQLLAPTDAAWLPQPDFPTLGAGLAALLLGAWTLAWARLRRAAR